LTGRGLCLDRTCPVSTSNHCSFNSIDRTRFTPGPDAEIMLTRVREGKCCDQTWLGNRSNASTVHSVYFQRGTSLTGRVRSSPIGLVRASGQSTERFLHDQTRLVTPDRTHCASGHSAPFSFQFDRCHRPDASCHVDRRVRSVRKMLSWHITVGIDYGEYKYIPYTSICGLLLICSAEKHLFNCKEVQEL
jgi:hypothetical protein